MKNSITNVSFKDWAQLIDQAFGKNGHVGIIYSIAALFSDIIFEDFGDRFPMLYIHGKPGSGKTLMAQSLLKVFAKDQEPVVLGNTTMAGLINRLSKKCNSLVCLDEYRNNLDYKELNSIRNIYDRIGYEIVRNGVSRESEPIQSAVIINGQEFPTKDPALFSRVILISLSEKYPNLMSNGQFAPYELIFMHQKRVSNIANEIKGLRPVFDQKFKETYEGVLKEFSKLIDNKDVVERMIQNYAVLFTTMFLVHKMLDLPFTLDEFEQQLITLLLEQHSVIANY